MRLYVPLAALAVVGLALPASSVPIPTMLAQATLEQGGGTAVVWTNPGSTVDHFVVSRSHAGSAFTAVATVDGSTFAYLDPTGQASDIYMVDAFVSGSAAFTSNPAPATPGMFCALLDWDTFPPSINWQCITILPPECPPMCIRI